MSPFMKFNSVEEKARFMGMQGYSPMAPEAYAAFCADHWPSSDVALFANEPTVNHANPVDIDWLQINEEFS